MQIQNERHDKRFNKVAIFFDKPNLYQSKALPFVCMKIFYLFQERNRQEHFIC